MKLGISCAGTLQQAQLLCQPLPLVLDRLCMDIATFGHDMQRVPEEGHHELLQNMVVVSE